MTNPTSNFGWQMPTPTDLVTDLPADFEVFGQAVDTSMADLKGGTTGQILSKATNTDMDFTWITNDVGDITAVTVTAPITGGGTSGSVGIGISAASTSASGAVQLSDSTSTTSSVLASTPTATKAAYDLAAAATPKSTFTAKGSIAAATAASTPANLTVGSNGTMLVADSATATGLNYIPNTAGAKNGLINSAFDVSQRGTTITGISTDNTYTADRWYVTRGGNLDYALKTVAGGNNPPANFDSYGQYINQTAANAFITVQQTLETKDSLRFAGVTCTLSFYARATANTTKSKSITASIGYNTTADTKINTLVGTTTFTTSFGTAATDWTYCTLTVGIPSTAKTAGVYFVQQPVGGLAVGDGFEITGVQLERSAVATAFQRNSGTTQAELAACQRYYYRAVIDAVGGRLGSGYVNSTIELNLTVPFPIPMRTKPTALEQTGTATDYQVLTTGNTITTCNAVPIISTSTQAMQGVVSLQVAAGLIAGQAGTMRVATANAYLGWSAEL
jgi:hypothetical protein